MNKTFPIDPGRQFLVFSLIILILGMLVIGANINRQIEKSVLSQISAVTALYVDSVISPILGDLADSVLGEEEALALDQLLKKTALSRQIVSFKLWDRDGVILYSPNQALVGQAFPENSSVQAAFAGEIVSGVSPLDENEHVFEKAGWDHLIETYTPIHGLSTGSIIAVAEFYQTPDQLDSQVDSAQLQSWLIVGLATALMYVLLVGIFSNASRLIESKNQQVLQQVDQLRVLLDQNTALRHRIQRAAGKATALNEQYLRRVASDLHDGPVQDIALAVLRVTRLGEAGPRDIAGIQESLDRALIEIRQISAGLNLPELADLTPNEVVQRAVTDYERKAEKKVSFTGRSMPPEAPVPIKITIYRVLQEALMNGFRHAAGENQSVHAEGLVNEIRLEISDRGGGFTYILDEKSRTMGISGMQERVEVLGGTFQLHSELGRGTTIVVSLPLNLSEN